MTKPAHDHDEATPLTPSGLIRFALRVRASNARGASADAAALRAALTPATEAFAYSRTEPYLTALTPSGRAGTRRAAAICATATNAPQASGADRTWGVGDSLRVLYARENPNRDVADNVGDGIIQAVNTLPLLDQEAAAASLAMLISRCSDRGVPVNFHDLAQALTHWGNGIDQRSVETRGCVVSQFYQHTSTRTPTSSR